MVWASPKHHTFAIAPLLLILPIFGVNTPHHLPGPRSLVGIFPSHNMEGNKEKPKDPTSTPASSSISPSESTIPHNSQSENPPDSSPGSTDPPKGTQNDAMSSSGLSTNEQDNAQATTNPVRSPPNRSTNTPPKNTGSPPNARAPSGGIHREKRRSKRMQETQMDVGPRYTLIKPIGHGAYGVVWYAPLSHCKLALGCLGPP